jgi:uncharacterized membrane protein YecN with MAPEG domain
MLGVAFWVCLWMVIAPLTSLANSILLTSADLGFKCPWTIVGITNLAGGIILVFVDWCQSCRSAKKKTSASGNEEPLLRNADPMQAEMEAAAQKEEKKQLACKIGQLALLQCAEIGLGGVVQTGLSLGLRNACDMLTPVIALAFGIRARAEKHDKWLLTCVCTAAIGGLLAVPESFDISNWEYLPMALLVRVVAVAKWMRAQAWMHSLDPHAPPPMKLAHRILAGAGAVGLELTIMLQRGCFSALFQFQYPVKVLTIMFGMSIGFALLLLAEFKALHAASRITPMFLAFLIPTRCAVLLIVDAFTAQKTWWIHWLGMVIFVFSAIGYAALRCEDVPHHAEPTRLVLVVNQAGQQTDVTKTIIRRGDDRTVPMKEDKVRMRYVGMFADTNTVFDDNEIEFDIGVGHVIQGWDKGALRMSLGEKAVLEVPSNAAYGRRGLISDRGVMMIPPNTDLRFKIHMKSIMRKMSGDAEIVAESTEGCMQM